MVTQAADSSPLVLDTHDVVTLTAVSIALSVLYSIAGTAIATWIRTPPPP